MNVGDRVLWVGHAAKPGDPDPGFVIVVRYEPGAVFETLAGAFEIAEPHYDLAHPSRPRKVILGSVGESKLRLREGT